MYEFLEESVRHSMTSPARTVAPEMSIGDFLRLFTSDDVNAYPVESNGRLARGVSKADAMNAFAFRQDGMLPHYDDVMGTAVEEIMSRHVMTVNTETRLQRVLYLIGKYRFKSLPVVDAGNRILGVIAREDVIRALARCNRRQSAAQELPLVAPPVGYYAIA